MMHKSLVYRFLYLVFAVGLTFASQAQEGNPDQGKTLFRNNCASCHNKNMVAPLTGPALGGVQERWADYPIEDLYAWVKNSQALIATGHPRAVEVYNANNKSLMQAFPALTDEDVTDILAYVDGVYTGTYGASAASAAGASAGGPGTADTSSNKSYFLIIIAFLAILALILTRVMSRVKFMADREAGLDVKGPRSLWSILTSKGVISLLIFALIVFGGYTTVNNAIGLNRMQDYQPEQPIAFSHETHAGLHKIECQYCHDGARRSKHSVIPATNTCMNCHKAVKVGSKHGTAEITKIFAAAGFNPNDDTYIENYDELSEEEIEKIYKTWIQNQYIQEAGKLDRRGDRTTEDQWSGIKEALTSPTKPRIQGPIEWVRIHNLPDHVYFNHSQHVTVGELECQDCHGPVETMEVVKQHSPLSMGWCINCHRQTEVKFDNPYYTSYEKYHEELKDGERSGVTVEEIGGLECQKCHY